MSSVFSIIKSRWPEVAMVVVFQVAAILLRFQLFNLIQPLNTSDGSIRLDTIPGWAGFLIGFGTIVFSILYLLLWLGFLRTSYTDGAAEKNPAELVKTGRHFFWRIF